MRFSAYLLAHNTLSCSGSGVQCGRVLDSIVAALYVDEGVQLGLDGLDIAQLWQCGTWNMASKVRRGSVRWWAVR